jgi:hypothetical protein
VSRFRQLQGTFPRGKVVVIGFDFQEGFIRSCVHALDRKEGEKGTRREKEQRERHRRHRFYGAVVRKRHFILECEAEG